MADEPLDGEFGLDYQIFILRRMVGELPKTTRQLINEQIDEVIKAVAVRNILIKDAVLKVIEDLRLDVIAVEHDVESTRRERDALQSKLDELL